MPVERLHQRLQIFSYLRKLNAFLHRGAAADALDHTQIGVMGNEPAVVGERLHHRKRARGLRLYQQLLRTEPERRRCGDEFVRRGGARTPALAVEIDRFTNTGNCWIAARSFLLRTTTEAGCGMPIASKVRQASILSCTRRSAAKSGTTVATSSRLRCADRTATCSCVGSSTSMARSLAMRFAAEPGHRIVGEARHPMQRADMTCEAGEAEWRRGQNFNVVTKRAQPCRDLAGGQTGTFAEEHAHDIISGYLGFARAQE
jgi:hypothetical protein